MQMTCKLESSRKERERKIESPRRGHSSLCIQQIKKSIAH